MKQCVLGLWLVASLTLLCPPAVGSRPPNSGTKKSCLYSNATCDDSGPTFTCQDQACSTYSGTVGPWTISGGSSTFHKNHNVTMKVCKPTTYVTYCQTLPKDCGLFKYYVSTGCTGQPVYQKAGWQEDCH